MRQQEEREIIQESARDLSTIHPHILLTWATGCGKTKACLGILDADNSGEKWLILVPDTLQVENLKADIKKHNYEYLYDTKIENIICYASFEKYAGRKLNIWLNEVQKLSLLKTDISKTVQYKRILADSATIPWIVRKRLEGLGKFYEFPITLDEAIEREILPKPTIKVIYTNLDDKIARNEVLYNKKKALLTDKGVVDKFDKDIEYWIGRINEKHEPWISNKINILGSLRKKSLAKGKNEAAEKLIEELAHKRFICFTGSVEQCNKLGKTCAVNYTKNKAKNLETLEKFNNFEIDHIFANKMGKEGLNLEGVEAVIILQLGSGNDGGLEFLQTTGRGLRAISPEIYILVAADTHDEKYLTRALSNINQQYVKYGRL